VEDAAPDPGSRSGTERRVGVVPATHPDALRLTAARRAAYPHWAAGWDLDDRDEFVVVYDDDAPAAGAAFRHGPDGITRARRLCASERVDDVAGAVLLDALEGLARAAGSSRVRLDSSAFLSDACIPWQARGYETGPPYDGNADVEVWTERVLGG
jgi:hypothetical protein